MNLLDNLPALHIQSNEDGTIMLEQSAGGNAERVAIHPLHVRHLAERLGMVREVSASDEELLRAERGHVALLRQENDRLKRNMLRLREHALALQHDFAEHADWKHADLVEPMNQINGVVALFDMACDVIADDYDAHMPVDHAAVTREHATSNPKTDGFEAPPKTGGFGDGVVVTPGHVKQRQNGPAANGRGAAAIPGARSAGGAPSAPSQDLHPRSSSDSKPLQLNLEGGHGQ